MTSQRVAQTPPQHVFHRRVSGLSDDLLRVAAILAVFAGLALGLSLVGAPRGIALEPPAEDWHGNVARSGN
jgi:hypothetical protein